MRKIDKNHFEYETQEGEIWTVTRQRRATWKAECDNGDYFFGTSLADVRTQLEEMDGLESGSHVLISKDELEFMVSQVKSLRKSNGRLQAENFKNMQAAIENASEVRNWKADFFELLRHVSNVEHRAAKEILKLADDQPSELLANARLQEFFEGTPLADAIIQGLN